VRREILDVGLGRRLKPVESADRPLHQSDDAVDQTVGGRGPVRSYSYNDGHTYDNNRRATNNNRRTNNNNNRQANNRDNDRQRQQPQRHQ